MLFLTVRNTDASRRTTEYTNPLLLMGTWRRSIMQPNSKAVLDYKIPPQHLGCTYPEL